MRFLFALALTSLASVSFSQQDVNVIVDLLRAPSSPASVLTGIAPSEIEKPTDVSSFMMSLQQASNNFTQIPKSYAIDFAPGLVFDKRNLTIDRFRSNTLLRNIAQSFTISAAFRNLEEGEEDSLSVAKTKLGFGLKFSFLRGDMDHKTDSMLNGIVELQRKILNDFEMAFDSIDSADNIVKNAMARMRALATSGQQNSPEFVQWQQIVEEQHEKIKAQIIAADKDRLAQLQSMAKDFRINRVHWKLDFAGGIVVDFLDRRFNNSYVTKGGAWLTGGYETESGWSFLGIGRYLLSPDKVFADDNNVLKSANISTFDAGARLIYSYPKSRFSLSSESIYRSILNNKEIGSSWRLTINADYDIGNNKKITFAFGRDFNGTISKGGNLIAALNFLAGFGNHKTSHVEKTVQ